MMEVLKKGVLPAILFSDFIGLVYQSTLSDNQSVESNDLGLKIEVADSVSERKKGLSGRESIANDEGLVLVFDEEDYHGIWMKEMNFSIDIIWINQDKKVVDYRLSVVPETYPEIFLPGKPAKYVLEVKSGFVEQEKIEIGDKLDFLN